MSRRLALVALLLAAWAAPSLADDTDILGTALIEPNVMILLDSSGSMDDSITGGRKIDIAKSVVTNLISTTPGVRFGVMKFAPYNGAMVAEIGSATSDIVTAVNGIDPGGWTPLGDAADAVGEYFGGSFGSYDTPIDIPCRLNMVIVVSDGLENQSNETLTDVATTLFVDDHSPLPGLQNLVVHTVGFAIPDDDEVAANAFLQQSADNGGGTFYSTSNAAELAESLQQAITAVLAGSYSFASVAVPSTSTTGVNRLYQASIEVDGATPFWRGRLAAYQRDPTGRVPTGTDGLPLAAARVWDAGELLAARAPSSRTIYTSIGGTRHAFDASNGAITPAMLGLSSTADRTALIEFIRGVDTSDEDGDGNTSEARDWPLGDILHSQPVLISPPMLISRDSVYQAFRAAHAARPRVLIVGANDGMLHAFRESDGVELWGYVPPDLLDTLSGLRAKVGTHPYYVDSSPVAADVLIGGAYRTIVVFGERRGGRSYHALDVTDPTNPVPLWARTDARFGETWSVPAIGRVSISGTPTDVVFVGGGYDTDDNNATGTSFFVLDAATGSILWSYENDGSTDDRRFMNFSLAARPTALDLDGDGLVDRVYIGDVGGQLWKFDVSNTTVSNWAGKRLFAAAPGQANPPAAGPWLPSQAIYAAPSATLDAAGTLWLFFGTGDLNNPGESSANRLFGLKDTTTMANGNALTESSLVDVTSTDASGGNGWYVRLPANEKVFRAADVFDGSVFYSSFSPVSVVTCSSGAGPAKLYAMQLDTGYAAYDWTTGDKLDPTDSSQARSTEVGTGIPGDPRVVTTIIDGVLETSIVTSTSERQVDDQGLPAIALRRFLYWREIY